MNTKTKNKYFQLSSKYISRNCLFISFTIFIEYFTIFAHSLTASIKVRLAGQIFRATQFPGKTIFIYASPYTYYRKAIICAYDNNNSNYYCSYPFYYLLIPPSLIIIFLIFCNLSLFKEIKRSCLKDIFSAFIVNFYDLIFFRVLSIFIFDIFINFFTSAVFQSECTLRFIFIGISLIIIPFKIFIFYVHVTLFNIRIKLHAGPSYPFDSYLSIKYDRNILFLKILICLENNSFDNMQNYINYVGVFLNLLVLLMILTFTAEIIYSFIYNPSTFFINKYLNMVRIFLLFVNSLCIFASLLFPYDFEGVYAIVLYLSLFVFTMFLILVLNRLANNKIIYGTNYRAKIKFILHEHLSSSLNSVYIHQIIVDHKSKCFMTNCQFCQKLKEYSTSSQDKSISMSLTETVEQPNYDKENFKLVKTPRLTPEIFLTMMYNNYKFHINNGSEILLSNDDYRDHDLIKVAMRYIGKTNKLFRLQQTFYFMIQHYTKLNDISLVLNLKLYFEEFSQENINELKKFKFLETIDDLIFHIQKFLHDIEDFLLYKDKTPKEWIRLAKEIKSLKIVGKALSHIENQQNYQISVIKLALEEIFNSPLYESGIFFRQDLKFQDEFFNFHFSRDRFLVLKYDIEKNSFIITQSGPFFLQFNQTRFESLLPEDFREKEILTLKELLNRNRFVDKRNFFEFIISDNSGYINEVTMKYVVYPSFENNDIYINGEYRNNNEDILIFELCYAKGQPLEALHSFSNGIGNLFSLTPRLVRLLSDRKQFIFFNEMFIKDLGLHDMDIETKYENVLYVINFSSFFSAYSKYIILNSDEIGMGKYEAMSQLNNLQKLKNECDVNPRKISLTRKNVIYQPNKTFIIYSAKIDMVQHQLDDNDGADALYEKGKSMKFDTLIIDYAKSFYGKESNSSIEVHLSSTSSTNLTSYMKIDRNHSMSVRKKEYRNFQKFTLFIFFFNIFLLILTVVFLVIETTENEKFKHLFSIYIDFRRLNRYFFHNTLSFFSNLCIAERESEICINKFMEFSEKFKTQNSVMSDYMINKYIERELDLKADGMQENLKTCEKELLLLNSQEMNNLLQQGFQYHGLKRSISGIEIYTQNISFEEAVEIYVNTISLIINSEGYFSFPLYIITLRDNLDLSNIYNPSAINEIQMFSYSITLNYSSFLRVFFEISDVIKREFDEIISKNQIILLSFTISLLFLHGVLLLLCFFFMISSQNIMDGFVREIIDKINNPSYLHYLIWKFRSIKTLCQMYEENPIDILEKLNDNRKKILVQKKDGDIQATLNQEKNANPHKSEFIRSNLLIVMKSFIRIIAILFVFYFSYCISYYFIFEMSLNKLYIAIDYFDKNSAMENNIFIDLGLIHLMILTNQTDIMLEKKLSNFNEDGYVTNGIQKTFTLIKQIQKFEKLYPEMFPRISKHVNFACDTLFKELNDSTLYQTNQFYPTRNYCTMVEHLCHTNYALDTYKDDYLFYEVITCNEQKLLNLLKKSSYSELKQVSDSDLLYSLYTDVLILFRQLRTYANDQLFVKIVSTVSGNYSLVVITFLLLNFLVEIFIFAVLYRWVIKRIGGINKNVIILYKSLSN